MFGDYSSYSDEMDHISDVDYGADEDESTSEAEAEI